MGTWMGSLRAILAVAVGWGLIGGSCGRNDPPTTAASQPESPPIKLVAPSRIEPAPEPGDELFSERGDDFPITTSFTRRRDLEAGNPNVSIDALRTYLVCDDAHLRWMATRRLAEIGPEGGALAGLLGLAALEDPDLWVRRGAVDALGWMDEKSLPALPALLTALDDPDEEIRWQAAYAVGRMSSRPESCVPLLIERLDDPAFGVRNMAAYALGCFGKDAVSAVDPLQRLAAGPEEMLRRTAGRALFQIESETRSANAELSRE